MRYGGIIVDAIMQAFYKKNMNVSEEHSSLAKEFYMKQYFHLNDKVKAQMFLAFKILVGFDEKVQIELDKLVEPQLEESKESRKKARRQKTREISSSPFQRIPMLPYTLLTTQIQFSTAAKHFSLCTEVAVDCEGVNMSNTGILCLVQIAAPAVFPGIYIFQVEK